MPLLKLDHDDPEREMAFEIETALRMSPEERLNAWHRWNLEYLEWMQELHGHQDTPSLTKRESS